MSKGAATQAAPKRPGLGARRVLLALWPAAMAVAWGGYLISLGMDRELLPATAVAVILMAPPVAWLVAAAHWTAEPALRMFAVAHAVAWALIVAERLIWGAAEWLEEIVEIAVSPYFLGLMTLGFVPPLVPAVACGRMLWRGEVAWPKRHERLATAGLAAYQWLASYVAWMIGHS